MPIDSKLFSHITRACDMNGILPPEQWAEYQQHLSRAWNSRIPYKPLTYSEFVTTKERAIASRDRTEQFEKNSAMYAARFGGKRYEG